MYRSWNAVVTLGRYISQKRDMMLCETLRAVVATAVWDSPVSMRPIALLHWASFRRGILSLPTVYMCNWFQRGEPMPFKDLRPTSHETCMQTRSSQTSRVMHVRRNLDSITMRPSLIMTLHWNIRLQFLPVTSCREK